jgi:hypothetical protein
MEVNYSYVRTLRNARRPLYSIFVLIVSFQLGFGLTVTAAEFVSARCRWLPLTPDSHRIVCISHGRVHGPRLRRRVAHQVRLWSSNDADDGKCLPPTLILAPSRHS